MRGKVSKLLRKLYPNGRDDYKQGKVTWSKLSHKDRGVFCQNIRKYLTAEKPVGRY